MNFARLTLFFLLAAPNLALPQSSVPKVGAVHIKGLSRFEASQLSPFIKVAPGSSFNQSLLDSATESLGRTGAFEEVRYSYRPENGMVTVDFIVKEAAHFRRCTFDNFPFAARDEILAYLEKQVPLFDGSAPDFGSMLDDIGNALESLAKTKGIAAKAQHIRYSRLGSPDFEYLFRISGPSIKITSVRFDGAVGIPEADLAREAKPLLARDFSVVSCREFGANVFVPYYRERGYLKVKVVDPSSELLPSATPGSYEIQVTYPVAEGLVYDWDGAQWSGNQALSSDQLNALLPLKSGEIANSKKIEASWEAVQKEYGKHGYIRARLRPSPVFDDSARKVHFPTQITEGAQFRMGEFLPQGFPEPAASKLKSKWKLKPGDIFDASYVDEFLKKELASALPHSNAPAKLSSSLSIDDAQHTVNVKLELK